MDTRIQLIIDVIHEEFVKQLDPFMKEHGFNRIKKSLTYRRKVEYGVQALACNSFRGYSGVKTDIEWFFDKVMYDRATREVFREEKFLLQAQKAFEKKGNRLGMKNLLNLIPMPERMDYIDFFQYCDLTAIPSSVTTFHDIVETWVIPFMDSHSSFEAIEEEGNLLIAVMGYIDNKRYDDALRAVEKIEYNREHSSEIEAESAARSEQMRSQLIAFAQNEGFQIITSGDYSVNDRSKVRSDDWSGFYQAVREYIIACRK